MLTILEGLPRLAKLYAEFVYQKEQNFFSGFPKRLRHEGSVTYRYYQQIEEWLSYIPDSEWDKYRVKIGKAANIWIKYRFWEKLHDVFNEALGAKVLATEFHCRTLELDPNIGSGKSPDWRGFTDGRIYYAEVKTCNHSDAERESWYSEMKLAHTVSLPDKLKAKLSTTYEDAIIQLTAPLDASSATKVVILVLNPDHNIDPLTERLEPLFTRFLEGIERTDYPIKLCLLRT